ncbi:MAG TPA: 3-oxoacyl-[acyl-carrier-protein] reductase [bacterium]|nr:3-oxoacyl-[acyl-carrier-protein] reductase [bacterium]HPQ66089.1 3-oxoacyl-[acyl-carrier-protein] reductase [bacterium]
MELEGKRAIVTGAARGIGRAIALALADAGADVAVMDLKDSDCSGVVAEIKEKGRQAAAFGVNVAEPSSVVAGVNKVLDLWGAVDIVVNNAGITRDSLLVRMSDDDWEAVLDVNLKGTFNVCRAVARPMMKQRSGVIVNIASIVGLMGNAGQANYSASKGGVVALTKSLAREMAPRSVRVNAVAPGFIETAMTDKIPQEIREKMVAGIPLGRMGVPGDVASAVVFLASPAAAYITGHVLVVDGGMYI